MALALLIPRMICLALCRSCHEKTQLNRSSRATPQALGARMGKIVHWYSVHLRRCSDDGTKETLESWALCGTDVDETRVAAIEILEGRRSIVGADSLAMEERGGGLVWEYPDADRI
ncbi:hypothetical protein CK230_29630 [Mesorhizobium sp. WSM3859]|nr:hypothetical protein CK230_29630 [Mesorhizobium sp. WSM3859]